MNRSDFIKELSYHLRKMTTTEKNKFITYYDEIISDYIENGVPEEEAVGKVGIPKMIAEELLENYDYVKTKGPLIGSRILNVFLLILGFPLWGSLLLAGILLLLSFYIVLWCVPLVTGAGCVGYFSTCIIGIIGAPFIMAGSLSVGMVQLGTAIASFGISVLLGMATLSLSRVIIKLTKQFNNKLVSLFRQKVVIR